MEDARKMQKAFATSRIWAERCRPSALSEQARPIYTSIAAPHSSALAHRKVLSTPLDSHSSPLSSSVYSIHHSSSSL